jgi:Na+:H+ antiporter, NhaA family
MIAGLVLALAWSLSHHSSYRSVTRGEFASALQGWGLGSLHAVSLNALLTLFFLAIGLELAREFKAGRFATWSVIASPLLAALGGMVVTALSLLSVGALTHTPLLVHGWGIPMATDIALTLGSLSLLGARVPTPLRLFVLTLAVLDDVGSVIALAFTRPLQVHHWFLIGTALLIGAVALVLTRRGHTWAMWVALVGAWVVLQRLGVEPALAGVIVGVAIPVRPESIRLERALDHVNAYLVLPLFSFVATGIALHFSLWHARAGRIIFAMLLVRVLGKALGIFLGVRLSELVGGVRTPELHGTILIGVGFLCAIGFTVPLVFTSVLVSVGSTPYNAVTVGLLLASLVGGALGLAFLRFGLTPHQAQSGR